MDRPIDKLIRRCVDKRIITVSGACRLWIELDPGREKGHNAGPEHYCPDCAPTGAYDPVMLELLTCAACGRASIGHDNACVWCGATA